MFPSSGMAGFVPLGFLGSALERRVGAGIHGVGTTCRLSAVLKRRGNAV